VSLFLYFSYVTVIKRYLLGEDFYKKRVRGFEGSRVQGVKVSRCQGVKGEEIGTEAQRHKVHGKRKKMRGKRRKAKSQRFKLEFWDV